MSMSLGATDRFGGDVCPPFGFSGYSGVFREQRWGAAAACKSFRCNLRMPSKAVCV